MQNLTAGLNGRLTGFIIHVCSATASESSSKSACLELTQSPSELRLSVDELHPWYFYHVRVAAANDAGVGPFHPPVVVRMLSDGRRAASDRLWSHRGWLKKEK